MNYSKLSIIRTIKEFYQTETDFISPHNSDIKFFRKTKYPNEFLALNFVDNKDDEIVISLFKSDNFNYNKDKFYEDFDANDIPFKVDNINTLNTILNANIL